MVTPPNGGTGLTKPIRSWNQVFTAPSRDYRPMMVARGRPQLNGQIARRNALQQSYSAKTRCK